MFRNVNRIIELSLTGISEMNINQISIFLNQFPNLRFLHLHIQNRRMTNGILLANINEIIQTFQSLSYLKIELENDIELFNDRLKMNFTDITFDGVIIHLWF